MSKAAVALPLVLLALPVGAQEVAECDPPPSIAALVEPWEDTSAVLAEGAVRLAVIEAGQGAVALVVLTLPPPDGEAGADRAAPAAPPPRRCRLVIEGGLGFAGVDLAGLATVEDPAAGTFTATLPALRFVPESTDLEEVALVLTFGVADDSLRASIEAAP